MIRQSPVLSQQFVHRNPKNPKQLVLVLDVSTCWNSQYDMLACYRELRTAVEWFLNHQKEAYRSLMLRSTEWIQVKSLLQLLEPLNNSTKSMMISKTATIHKVWQAYHGLFEHLEAQQDHALTMDDTFWNGLFAQAIENGLVKLQHYNGKTELPQGKYLNIATILDLEVKLSLYEV